MAGKTTELPTSTDDEEEAAAATVAAKALTVETNTNKLVQEDEEEFELEELEENVPPLHLHAMRIPARLQGSSTHARSRSSSRSRPSSRSTSPTSTPKGGTGGGLSSAGGSIDNLPDCAVTSISSASSLDGNASERSISTLDPDIFTDQKGFEEMEPPPPHEIATGALASPNLHNSLPPVSERLSEETLEDCHAFSDVVVSLPRSGGSRPSSVCGGSLVGNESILLETLDECFEEDEEEDEGDEEENEKEGKKQQQEAGTTSASAGADTTAKKKLFEGEDSTDVASTLKHKNQGVKPGDLIERLDHIQVSEGEEKGSR